MRSRPPDGPDPAEHEGAAVIALIDYGAGNLTSVRKALAAIGAEVLSPRVPADLAGAGGVIVPGVGHFQATAALDAPWREAILASVRSGRPLLGICLGLQWLFEGSEEAPSLPGLGILKGTCRLLTGQVNCDADRDRAGTLKVPHVGWNTVAKTREDCAILAGVPDRAHVYFTHSYAAPVTDACAASTTHGETFASVVSLGRVSGVQFHPEKSSDIGLAILRNFLTLART